MSNLDALANQKKEIIAKYAQKSDPRATLQIVLTILPFMAFWYLAVLSTNVSYVLTAGCIAILCLFLLRVFVLMHECGHNSLFETTKLNKIVGFFLGVICGMPQYVWSKHHAFHHATNGNWTVYRGPLATLSTEEFDNLSEKKQRIYKATRNIFFAPIGGFLYLIVNPRINWIKGNIHLLSHIIRGKKSDSNATTKSLYESYQPKYWKTGKEYWHMTMNNIVLLSIWVAMSAAVGPLTFFSIYIISLSLSGAGGIILFTVQHNFEDSYAADETRWDYDTAAVEGTSFLVIPRWLNWFTANIAYHHIHHLSAAIPNYRLEKCHEEYGHLFDGVKEITLKEIPSALKNNLWDIDKQRITSIQKHLQHA